MTLLWTAKILRLLNKHISKIAICNEKILIKISHLFVSIAMRAAIVSGFYLTLRYGKQTVFGMLLH